jgi:hypothetical protein
MVVLLFFAAQVALPTSETYLTQPHAKVAAWNTQKSYIKYSKPQPKRLGLCWKTGMLAHHMGQALLIRKYRDSFLRKNAAFIYPPIVGHVDVVADVIIGIRWATPTCDRSKFCLK